jgi:Flp pilus assembly pilin Flp
MLRSIYSNKIHITGDKNLKRKFCIQALLRNDDGATAIEYGLIAGAMALMLIPVLQNMTTGSGGLFQSVLSIFDHPMFQPGYFS